MICHQNEKNIDDNGMVLSLIQRELRMSHYQKEIEAP